MKISDMDHDQLIEAVAQRTGMPGHYVEAWFGAADERGLDTKQAVMLLNTVRGMVGDDLDSYIYGDDMDMAVEMLGLHDE